MAQSGHPGHAQQCPLLGVKRTWRIYEYTPLNKPVARRSRDGSFRMRSSSQHAAASALPTAQSFDKLSERGAWFESVTDKLPFRNKAMVLTG
jgi:hypothetical protein